MRRSIFKLKFLTPALVAGATPKKITYDATPATAELRESSIRGQLRWWHRFLGYDQESEDRIYGSINRTHYGASRLLLRILDPPPPVEVPQNAHDLQLEHHKQVNYIAFNIRTREDSRSVIPEGTEFSVLLQARHLTETEWLLLIRTMEVFACLGSLGTRARRCFGSLTLVSKDGISFQRPSSWNSLFESQRIAASHVSDIKSNDWRHLFHKAGEWLRKTRRDLKQRNSHVSVFGMASKQGRKASSILLRPDFANHVFTLLAIGSADDLKTIGLPTSRC